MNELSKIHSHETTIVIVWDGFTQVKLIVSYIKFGNMWYNVSRGATLTFPPDLFLVVVCRNLEADDCGAPLLPFLKKYDVMQISSDIWFAPGRYFKFTRKFSHLPVFTINKQHWLQPILYSSITLQTCRKLFCGKHQSKSYGLCAINQDVIPNV